MVEVELWGVLTIRSASVVGNAKATGIGLLGMDRVIPEARQKVMESMKLP